MALDNYFKLEFDAKKVNESFARNTVAMFCANLKPTISEVNDIKTAVSEAVTNSIVHGYKEGKGRIYITVSIFENAVVRIKIRDKGCGIEDVKQAMEPLFTTMGGERAGLGFAVMESFTDKVKVHSVVGKGTSVTLEKKINGRFLHDGQ